MVRGPGIKYWLVQWGFFNVQSSFSFWITESHLSKIKRCQRDENEYTNDNKYSIFMWQNIISLLLDNFSTMIVSHFSLFVESVCYQLFHIALWGKGFIIDGFHVLNMNTYQKNWQGLTTIICCKTIESIHRLFLNKMLDTKVGKARG